MSFNLLPPPRAGISTPTHPHLHIASFSSSRACASSDREPTYRQNRAFNTCERSASHHIVSGGVDVTSGRQGALYRRQHRLNVRRRAVFDLERNLRRRSIRPRRSRIDLFSAAEAPPHPCQPPPASTLLQPSHSTTPAGSSMPWPWPPPRLSVVAMHLSDMHPPPATT